LKRRPRAAAKAVSPDRSAAPDLPDRIHLKTPTRTFSSHFYYALLDGRIWLRPNEETTGIREPWCELGRVGLPTNDLGSRKFEQPVRIEAIVADADELIALSDAKHYYLIRFDNLSAIGTDLWRDGDGAPGGALLLDIRHRRNRGFSVGRRNQDVLYWDDAVGNPHSWGEEGITTLYLLSEDGREILIFDTGLQPNFGRHIPSPERGAFVAEAISASASTVFVIDGRGRMFTRLADFDVLGANLMFFEYSYTAVRRPTDNGGDIASMYTTISLPPADWKREPAIPLSGAAALSRDITILQNGEGNHARELRVGGIDSAGRFGYYTKQIRDLAWTFTETGEEIAADRWLAGSGPRPAFRSVPSSFDCRYVGELRWGSQRVAAELVDFNLFASPAQLRISSGDAHLDLVLHTIDAWTYTTRDDPGRDGTPLVFLAAISRKSSDGDPPLRAPLDELDRILRPRYLVPFSFFVRASTDYVEIVPNFLLTRVSAELTRVGSQHPTAAHARVAEANLRSGYVSQSNAGHLLMPEKVSKAAGGVKDVRWQKLRLNRLAFEEISAQRRAEMLHAVRHALIWIGFGAFNFLMRLITLAYWWPHAHNIFRYLGRLLHAQATTSYRFARDTRADFLAARVILTSRIENLEKELGPDSKRPIRLRRRPRRWRRLGR